MVVYAEYYFAEEKDIFGFVYKKYKTEHLGEFPIVSYLKVKRRS